MASARVNHLLSVLACAAALSACKGIDGAPPPERVDAAASVAAASSSAPTVRARRFAPPKLSAAAQVGKRIFFDETLSASGKMSCATCHDPELAYGPPNDLAVQLGGPDRTDAGTRAVPSLCYKEYTPAYADLLDNPDGMSAPGPGGGLTWDGRADTLAAQAKIPLLSPVEMANATGADVVAKLRKAPYAAELEKAFPGVSLGDTERAFDAALAALQAFQLEDPSFHPYSSKFDLHAYNKIGGDYTPAELRGSKIFSDPKIGNCASCHFPGAGLNGSSGLFTDFSYEAIGVPRNAAIPSNHDPSYVDEGLCSPMRTDHPDVDHENKFCGLFKAPTLRNVTVRRAFFHNGVIHSLEQAIRFYNTRDTRPELWYPTVGGTPRKQNDPSFPTWGLITTQYVGGHVEKYDDLPRPHRKNIDPQMPLDGRRPGSAPPMTEANMADLICFLETLTDGYDPAKGAHPSGKCID